MSVFMICERTIGLLRGNRLVLSSSQREKLEALDYEGLVSMISQDEAVSCARHFASVRDRLLQTYPWVCARAQTMPALLSQSQTGWEYTYAVPNDCIKILSLTVQKNTNIHRETVEQWEQWGNTICSHYPIPELRYTKRLTNTDEWSPLFESAFCFSLAAEIAASVTGAPTAFQTMEQGAQLRIEEAKRVGEIKMPLTPKTEMYGFHKFSDIHDPRYGDQEW